MPADPVASLLIVDDEAAHMKALRDTLGTEGYRVTGFTSPAAALEALRANAFDLVLTDLMMPEMDGIAFLREALAIDPTLAAIVMTGHGTLDTAVQAMQTGALDYILKPFRLSTVLPVLARSLAVRRVRTENIELQQAVGMYELSKAMSTALDFDAVLRKVNEAAAAQNGVRVASVQLAHGEADAAPEPCDLSVPMRVGGYLVGFLNFHFENPRRPVSNGQMKALRILASAAASALEATSLIAKVRDADRQYRRLTENAPDIIFRYDLDPSPRLAYVNRAVTASTGYTPDEFYADSGLIFRIVDACDLAHLQAVLSGERANGGVVRLRCTHRTGHIVWLEQRSMPVRDAQGKLTAIEAIARDVTERKLLEERLDRRTAEIRRSLVEKTALLKEVHHRVKNNLQVICSLLSMQISCAAEDALRPLNDAHSRVLSMSLIHELIYQSDTLADLNFGAYIEALASKLFAAYCVDPLRIHLEIRVEPINLSLDQSIPCGLILNELISNALKHAFNDGREGTIRITLSGSEAGEISLCVADDGRGLPPDFSMAQSNTLGHQVVSTLIRQLGAKLTVSGENGARFAFTWKLAENRAPTAVPA
ncbi:MAG TPA: response regulator [Bryobacteraceae bacterium]|jgi:PAS domain S-box-containing protein|nr:response regulator [Bryobacteraceae bacterium]